MKIKTRLDNTSLIIISAFLVILIFSFMMGVLKRRVSAPQSTFESEVNQLESQSSSDSIDSIQKDLNETDFTTLDSELGEIEAEIEAAY